MQTMHEKKERDMLFCKHCGVKQETTSSCRRRVAVSDAARAPHRLTRDIWIGQVHVVSGDPWPSISASQHLSPSKVRTTRSLLLLRTKRGCYCVHTSPRRLGRTRNPSFAAPFSLQRVTQNRVLRGKNGAAIASSHCSRL